jgi:tRNA (cytidine/uridine-2'-O-)-methyltransferase
VFHVVLFQPEIPPNTGNIIRLCANTGVQLHLIHPLGFRLEDSKLRRAGLDYHEWAQIHEYTNLADFMAILQPERIFAFTTKSDCYYHQVRYRQGDVFLFGPETRGLSGEVLIQIPPQRRLRIPMMTPRRSLNLSNAVAIAVYEALRQMGFHGSI